MFAITNLLLSFISALGTGSQIVQPVVSNSDRSMVYSATPSEFPCDETSFLPIQAWFDLATNNYLRNPVSRQWVVTHIARYRERYGAQNEYLVATAKHPLKGEIQLRIEREVDNLEEDGTPVLSSTQKTQTRGDLQDNDKPSGMWASEPNVVLSEGVNPKSLPRYHSYKSKASATSEIRQVGYALDIVRLYGHHHYSSDLISSLSLEGQKTLVPLAHLAILARVVHDEEALYNLFSSQGYWYCNMIACVIAKQQGCDFMAARSTGSSTESDSDFCYDPDSRKYYRIPIHAIRTQLVNLIEKLFLQRLQEFNKAVCSKPF
ncbi:hypothetical protein BDZ97DRAFT_506679 [Flammula alnicola]|nr:hypothetical protein BDZ97DRAFT_506679 [Flammula alnicola]